MGGTGDHARRLSRSLSGYLCGTHSGALRHRRGDRLTRGGLTRALEDLAPGRRGDEVVLGERPWIPEPGSRRLASALRAALEAPGVIDLVFYGSQARGSVTGFSDVDAVLVIADETAASPAALRTLRRRVLRAQGHILSYQPMQHHGFEVATPALLGDAAATLDLPPEAVSAAASLFGRGVRASFEEDDVDVARARFLRLAQQLRSVGSWPRHPWSLHRTLSMFELAPALFLQAAGRRVEKWRSFETAGALWPEAWWPYDVVGEIRSIWPNAWPRALRATLRAGPNPWVTVEAWRRFPATAEPDVRSLLDGRTLEGLLGVLARMESEVRA